jgi:hypothetical protein
VRCRVLLLTAICALAVPGAASACSYAVPRDLTHNELDRLLLRASDGAFIGRLVAVVPSRSPSPGGRYLFRIERRVKGRFPLDWTVVNARIGGNLCGISLRPGDRTGLMVRRRRGAWRADLLSQLTPRQLLRAARRH